MTNVKVRRDWFFAEPAISPKSLTICSMVMALVLIASTFPLVRETALILMQTTPNFIEVNEIEKDLLKVSQ